MSRAETVTRCLHRIFQFLGGVMRLSAAPVRAAGLGLALLLGGCDSDDSTSAPPIPGPPPDAPLAGLVNPFIGTAGDGQTFPGAVVPWGMVSPSPHTTLTDFAAFISGTIANAGYLHGEPKIFGFGQTHLSGVGCPDLGAPALVPTVGPVRPAPEDYGSPYEREHAHAGYYTVRLTDPGVHVEMTATARVGVHRFWFPERHGDANILLDVGRSVSWHRGDGTVRIVSETEVEGSVRMGLFCGRLNSPTAHFVARFDQPAVEMGTWSDGTTSGATVAEGTAGAFLRFRTDAGRPIGVAVGVSYVSVDNARENLAAELGTRTFDDVRDAAARAWHDALGRIRIDGGSEADRTRFYTALYHALVHPNVVNDVNGEYPTAGRVGSSAEGERYTVFSLWDTYRTLHPLLTLVYPERQLRMLRTLAGLAQDVGLPPKWELIGQEVNPMVGDPLAIVVADSYLKGLTDFDVEGLYQRMKVAAADPAHRPGVESYRSLGYVPMEEAAEVWGPVSTTLEYALADAALAELAEALGHTEDAAEFAGRARSYEVLYDESTGVLRPRNADGSFLEPFDLDALEGSAAWPRAGGPGYVEGTAWHYAFFVPHDVEGLVALHGSGTFVERLQWLFDTDRFVLWNEPDIAYPYLFDYVAGEGWRTQRAVRTAMTRFFGDGPDGIPGNDDTGTLSAWFVFSAMGFYPDAPGTPRYSIGSPWFDRVEIQLSPDVHDGASLVVEAIDNGPDRPYVASAEWNGVPHEGSFLRHEDLVRGGVLRLRMASAPPDAAESVN